VQTFDEFMSLAESGNSCKLDQYTSDVNTDYNAAEEDDSSYMIMAKYLIKTPMLLFSFGKAVGARIGILLQCC